MAVRPALPDDFDLPAEVNGWWHDPESTKNAHTWRSPDETAAVGVFSSTGRVYAKALDERVHGFARADRFAEVDVPDLDDLDERRRRKAALVATTVEKAVDWMSETDPDGWTHPDVNEAALVPPAGYELEYYFLEERDTTIFYHLEDGDEYSILFDDLPDADPTPENYPYLRIHCWNGSGNCEIALAPWVRAHDHEVEPVVEPPEECGLDVAVTLCREWVRENVDFGDDADVERATVGQSALAAFEEASN